MSAESLSHFTVQMKLYTLLSQYPYCSRKATELTAAGPVKLNMAYKNGINIASSHNHQVKKSMCSAEFINN